MTKLLYLHAGMHKTGTTSIQRYLFENEDFFLRNNIYVMKDIVFHHYRPKRETALANCFDIAHVLIDGRLKTPTRIRGETAVLSLTAKFSAANTVNARLKDVPCDTIILSAEAFSFLRTWREKLWFRIMFRSLRVRPIIFFRNKSDWLESWQAQLSGKVLRRYVDDPPPEGIFDFSETSWLVDYDRIRRFFSPNGIFLSYDDEIAENGSVIPPFLKSLGLDPEKCPSWDGIWLNNSAKRLVANARSAGIQ